MLLFEIGYELIFYLVMNVKLHYLLVNWNFCVYHWYGKFQSIFDQVIERVLYWNYSYWSEFILKGFHAGALFSKIFIISVFWHMEICLLSDLRLTPACLNIVLRGLDTEHRLLTAVLLALDASWLISSSLDIRGYCLTLDNCEICSHACYSWV